MPNVFTANRSEKLKLKKESQGIGGSPNIRYDPPNYRGRVYHQINES